MSGKQGRPSSVCPEAGWAFERTVEGSNTTSWYWLMLVVHTVIGHTVLIAASLVAPVAISIHDSLTLGSALLQEETSPASCEQPRFRS